MKIHKLLLFLAFFICTFVNAFSQEKYSKVQINADKNDYATLGSLGLPLDETYFYKDFIVTELPQNLINEIQNSGFEVKILIEDVSSFYAERNKNAGEIVRSKSTPVNFNLGTFGGNLSYTELLSELNQMHQLYPNLITTRAVVCDTLPTHNDSLIYWVKISDNPNSNEEEPEVLYTALTHAREPLGMMNVVYYMWYLLENYGTDPLTTYMVDNFEQYFIPVVNPDGYRYNQQTDPNGGGMWRKNRLNNGDGSYGVDLNRNFSHMWGYDDSGSSPYTDDDTYRGPSAGSEPETKNVMYFIENHDILIANHHHTYSNLLIYPFGYDENAVNPELDLFMTYAQILTRVNNFSCGRGWELLYPVNGDAVDWTYGNQQVYGFTAESGTSMDGFWPEQDRIIPICEGNLYMNQVMCLLAGAYAEASDKNPYFIPTFGYLDFDFTFAGLDTTATFTAYLQGTDIISYDTLIFDDYSKLQTISDSIFYVLDESVQYGDEITFDLVVNNGLYDFKFTVTKKVQKSEAIISDDGSNLENWTSTTWAVTNSDYNSAPTSITDSPNGEYETNVTTNIVSDAFDLSAYNSIFLSFFAKWDIESGYDYTQLSVSTNGGTSWTPLATENTILGNGGVQPDNQPVFEGTQSTWINQNADISAYNTNNVKFRFQLGSDSGIEGDGYYFDDFTVIASVDNLAPVITGQNTVNVNPGVVSTLSTNYLIVNDPDDTYPNGFMVFASEGSNYTLGSKPNEIIVNNGYIGNLTVPVKVSDGYNFSNTFNLNVNSTLGMIENNSKVSIYPNPASDILNITISENKFNEVQIIDMFGRVVISSEIQRENISIDISVLAKGVYFINLIGNEKTYSEKIIIE